MALNNLLRRSIHHTSCILRHKLVPITVRYEVFRGISAWQQNTLKLMYHRKRQFDNVQLPQTHRSEHQEWNYTAECFAFSQRLGEKLTESSLKTAFTHESYLKKEERQRMELGLKDPIMDLNCNNALIREGEKLMPPYIKAYLRYSLPIIPEEGIRALNHFLMSDETLSTVSKWIGTKDLILCEELSPSVTTLANTLRALVGALKVDQGEKHAEKFVLDFVLTYLAEKDLLDIWNIPSPELTLRKIIERERLPAPEVRLLNSSASSSLEACYIVGFYVNKQLIGSAPGETIAIAQEMAALECLREMFNLNLQNNMFIFGEKGYNVDLTKHRQHEHLTLNEWSISLANQKNQVGLLKLLKV